jgi:hypothetical protein
MIFAIYKNNGETVSKQIDDGLMISLQGQDIRPEFDYLEWKFALLEMAGIDVDIDQVEIVGANSGEEAILSLGK